MIGPIENTALALLPTQQEIDENPRLFFSDHLPGVFQSDHGIQGVIWNVFDPHLPCGYLISETEEQISQRQIRIIESLKKIMENNPEIDVILLQEAGWLKKGFADEFKESGWYSTGLASNLVLFNTCQNIDRIGGVTMQRTRYFGEVACVSFDLKNKRTVKVMNIQGDYAALPREHKLEIEALLTLDERIVVAGDFNIRIAPEHHKAQAIATGVVPPNFREASGPFNWTDGAFSGGKNSRPKQCHFTLLNPSTGKVADVTVPNDESDVHNSDITRMFPCVKIGVSRVEKFVQLLQGKLSPEVQVFHAANAHNKKGFMIAFTKDEKIVFEELCKIVDGKIEWMDGQNGLLYFIMINTAQFVEAQEWFFRRFYNEKNKSFFSPAIEFQTAPDSAPLCVLSRLIQLEKMLASLKDDGKSVEQCRQIKSELVNYTQSDHPVTALLSKAALVNYYLRFSEFNKSEFEDMRGAEENLPNYIIRHTHIGFAIEGCIDLLNQASDDFLQSLKEDQRTVVISSIDQVCQNMITLMTVVRNDLAAMIHLYNKAMKISDEGKSLKLDYETASKTVERYEEFDKAFKAFSQEFSVECKHQQNLFLIKKLDVTSLHKTDSSCCVM